MPAISIIVPIYNMEHLMRRCIDSLLAQTFTDYELLLIDDGSKDGSWSICQEYARKDPRVSIYHKENGGLSDARNYGLSKATGKYTIFADPDDWVSPEGLDCLYATAEREQADMTMCDLYREDEYSRHYVCQRPQSLQAEDVLKELFANIQGFTVNKLIRRDVYTRFGISYPKGIYGCEDQYTMAAILLHDIKIAYEPVAFYHYMYNSASLTRHYDERTYEMDMRVLEMFRTLLDGNPTQQLAVTYQENAVFTRAFWNGRDYYSSAAFQKRFAFFRNRVNSLEEMGVIKLCMAAACCGWYQLSVKLVFFLFETKQVIKRLKRLLF
ncbi:glycosyltransferase family 2 protein [Hallella sp.]|uniref:glycosyltransferase family 2 protein n=1 Tax=Hallella sp. TaxID=2980186 RepID=UPI00307A5BB6